MAHKEPLKVRIREAGGMYHWVNSRLIRYAGPASVGRMGDYTPPPCEGCGQPKSEHAVGDDGALLCPR